MRRRTDPSLRAESAFGFGCIRLQIPREDERAGNRCASIEVTRDSIFYFLTATFSRFALPFSPFFFPNLSNTAATISGNPTVASTNTSPKRPPSAGGTNLPHEIASLYGLPDSPPQ